MNPVFSIIVPVYNMETTIKRCVDSILAQTYKSYVLIVINDGSTDSTGALLASFNDKRIKYVYQENRGTSSARNHGVELANGKFILFVDADDWIEPNYLDTIYMETVANESDLYLFGLTSYNADGQQTTIVPSALGMANQVDFLTDLVKANYKQTIGLYGYIPNKLLLRRILIESDIRFNPELKLQEDYDFFLSYYRYCRTIYSFRYAGYHYECINGRRRGTVDYISLIKIQLKCLSLLESYPETLTEENKTILSATIANLSQSAYLELRPVTMNSVRCITTWISNNKMVLSFIRQNYTSFITLKRLILSGNVYFIYLYLLIWQLYLYIHRR